MKALVLGIAALFVLFVLARRVLRFAIRLALAGVLILILLAGGAASLAPLLRRWVGSLPRS